MPCSQESQRTEKVAKNAKSSNENSLLLLDDLSNLLLSIVVFSLLLDCSVVPLGLLVRDSAM